MEWIELAMASMILASIAVFLGRRKRVAAKIKDDAYLKRLEDLVQNSEQALENMHRGLEALQARAETSEPQLNSFIDAPDTERKELYEATALLLANGQSVERVARMLNLPVSQVELVQEVRKFVAGESQTRDRAERISAKDTSKRRGPTRPKTKVRPILLTDAVNLANVAGGNGVDKAGPLNGAAAGYGDGARV